MEISQKYNTGDKAMLMEPSYASTALGMLPGTIYQIKQSRISEVTAEEMVLVGEQGHRRWLKAKTFN